MSVEFEEPVPAGGRLLAVEDLPAFRTRVCLSGRRGAASGYLCSSSRQMLHSNRPLPSGPRPLA